MRRKGDWLLYGPGQVRRLFAGVPSSGSGKIFGAWVEEQKSKGSLALHPAIEVRRTHNMGYGLFIQDCMTGGIKENTPLVEVRPELLFEFSAEKSAKDASEGNEEFFDN